MNTFLRTFAFFLIVTISNISFAEANENIFAKFAEAPVSEEAQNKKLDFDYIKNRHNQVLEELYQQRVLDSKILKYSEDLTAFVRLMGKKVVKAMTAQDKINQRMVNLNNRDKVNSSEVQELKNEFNTKERYINITIYRIALASAYFEQLVKKQAVSPYFLAATKELTEADITEENVDVAYAFIEISEDVMFYLNSKNFPKEVDYEIAMYSYAHKYLVENAPTDNADIIEKIKYVLHLGAVSQLFVETIEAKGYGL